MLDTIQSLIAWTPMGLPAFLFVITLVVFFHELGHFLAARYFGVKMLVFSVGFGKEIFGWNDKHHLLEVPVAARRQPSSTVVVTL